VHTILQDILGKGKHIFRFFSSCPITASVAQYLRMFRWLLFFIVMGFGIVLGLFYAWVVDPVEYLNTTPDTLKIDYQADYVLMVAEAYSAGQDLSLAESRLSLLLPSSQAPSEGVAAAVVEVVEQAIRSAEPYYNEADLTLMRSLHQDLQAAGNSLP
jgi:hypothetical protein